MRRAVVIISICLGWTILVAVATLHNFWRPAITNDPGAAAFAQAARAWVPETFRGNLVLVVLEAGRPVAEAGIGPTGSVPDGSSVFQIASLSKWVTAAGVLVLADRGLIGLDDPVEEHLTRWRFPDTEFDSRGVTIRRLLAHTGGLTDGLGYNGFETASAVQSLEASLTEAADAMEGATGRVEIGREPGSRFAYSGGGYTILQMMVEEATGQTFANAMDDLVFRPAGMMSSSFEYEDIKAGLAPIFDEDGERSPHRFYTALAAASLYTTADDLAAFLTAIGRPRGEGGLLSNEMLAEMAIAEAYIATLPVWGLGTTIYVARGGNAEVIGHDGRNHPAINTAARLHLETGDGLVVLATGTTTLASDLADAWVYWRTGRVPLTSLDRILKSGIVVLVIGLIAMFVAAVATHRLRVCG
jgi:CubicO group peptidase (beta-lactamase class C family)